MAAVSEWWPNAKTFVREVVAEARKVSWPEPKVVMNTTIVVIVATFIVGFFLAGCDVVLAKALASVYRFFGIGV
jgi:preprotein translocase SecE subunit